MRRLLTLAPILIAAGVLACSAIPEASPPLGTAEPTAAATLTQAPPAGTPPANATVSPALAPTPPVEPTPTPLPGSTEGRDPEQISAANFDDVALAVDRAGNAHAAVSRADEGVHYLTELDGGWVAELIARPPAGGADRDLQIKIADDGTVHVVFVRWSAWHPCTFECPPDPSQVDGLYHVTGSAADGWSEARRLPLDIAPGGGVDGLDVALAAGQLHVTVRYWSDDSDSVWYGTNTGGEWHFEEAIADGWSASVAVTSGGPPVIAFTYGHDAGYGIGYAERVPGGSFSAQRVPGTDGGLWPHLALDGQGRPHIVFSHDDSTNYYTHLGDEGWSLPMPVTRHIVAAAALDSRASLHLIYDVGDGDAREGLWYATNRSGDLEAVQVDRRVRWVEDGPGAPSALAVDDAGRAHILYVVLYAEQGNGLWHAIVPGLPGD